MFLLYDFYVYLEFFDRFVTFIQKTNITYKHLQYQFDFVL